MLPVDEKKNSLCDEIDRSKLKTAVYAITQIDGEVSVKYRQDVFHPYEMDIVISVGRVRGMFSTNVYRGFLDKDYDHEYTQVVSHLVLEILAELGLHLQGDES